MLFIKKNSITLSLAAFIFISTIFIANQANTKSDSYHQIEVKSGDTLWKMAKEYQEYTNLSSIEFVKWVEKENSISDGRIDVGQNIILPVEIKEFNVQVAAKN